MQSNEPHLNKPSKLKIVRQPMDHALKEPTATRDADLLVTQCVAKLVSQSRDTHAVIPSILRMMSEILGLNRGRVLMPEDDKLKICYSYGLTEEERQRGVYELGEGVSGKVMRSGQIAVIQDIDDEPDLLFRAVDRSTLPPETVSYIAVPILDDGQNIGVLGCHRLRNRLRSLDSDLAMLRVLSAYISNLLTIDGLLAGKEQPLIDSIEGANNQAAAPAAHQILGHSAPLQQALLQTRQVAATNVTVLLTGESGTGKELFAQMLHAEGDRRIKPFIAINCAAIPDQLLESELFGHERGAFTGAVSAKKGKIESANGGTLFLDEIGDLSLELQAKLLRVLETKSIQRVGGVKPIAVDIRVVAATHKDLMQSVNEGKFRIDLFYRLNIFPLQLPALRDRASDIPVLAQHFLRQANAEFGRSVTFNRGVIGRLQSYDWPGNIRQLINVVKRAVLMSGQGAVCIEIIERILSDESRIARPDHPTGHAASHIFSSEQSESQPRHPGPYESTASDTARPYSWVSEDESQVIKQALVESGGNKTRAAASIGMTTRQLRYRMQKLGI